VLYKVFMTDSFADASDRIGVIEAQSIEEAARRLVEWNRDADLGDYITSEPKVEVEPDRAIIAYEVKDGDGGQGKDVYMIRPVGADILLFLANDWNLTFD